MQEIDVFNIEGKQVSKAPAPKAFGAQPKAWLINRAIAAENSLRLQPQGHYELAGMQTTAAYFGAMGSYRAGRHVGRAIRPREKLGGGALGSVRRIPSSVKGKRAHPHQVEKTLVEQINNREYANALKSAVSMAVNQKGNPFKVFEDISKISKSKEFSKFLNSNKLDAALESVRIKKVRSVRATRSKQQHRMLVVTSDDEGVLKASRNIKGVDACTLSQLKVEKLTPGGNPVKMVLLSSKALNGLDAAIEKASLSGSGPSKKKGVKNVSA
ncbi:MAG: 50S ribosomal protein L4 [Candidatus Marsarchaeota archaeon]|nr:50S ribosomal protein L4 [Candidatus Marsarchaeota archaeon]